MTVINSKFNDHRPEFFNCELPSVSCSMIATSACASTTCLQTTLQTDHCEHVCIRQDNKEHHTNKPSGFLLAQTASPWQQPTWAIPPQCGWRKSNHPSRAGTPASAPGGQIWPFPVRVPPETARWGSLLAQTASPPASSTTLQY